MATSAERRGEIIFFVCKYRQKSLRKMPVRDFKRHERGLKLIGHVSDRFSDLVRVFQTLLRMKLNIFSGAVSFCRRAALMKEAAHTACETPPPSMVLLHESPQETSHEPPQEISQNNRAIANHEKQKIESHHSKVESRKIDSESSSESHFVNV